MSAAVKTPQILSAQQIDTFITDGVLVVSNVISTEDIDAARRGLHQELAQQGVDVDNLSETAHHLNSLSSTGGAGGVLDIFYSDWKFVLMQHPGLFAVMSDLWACTYARYRGDMGKQSATDQVDNKVEACGGDDERKKQEEDSDTNTAATEEYAHPHGPFEPRHGFFYVNRVCFRVPDTVSTLHGKTVNRPLQRCLAPHVDCCPVELYGYKTKIKPEHPRWRPIQCFVALTDNDGANTGGFECVPGFHKQFLAYFSGASREDFPNRDHSSAPPVCVGEFSRLRPVQDADILQRFRHIPYKAGDIVLWDWRIPHANATHHVGTRAREVVYTGFLPAVPLNAAYATEQLRRLKTGLLPSDHWQKKSDNSALKDFDSSSLLTVLTPLGKRLMTVDPWEQN